MCTRASGQAGPGLNHLRGPYWLRLVGLLWLLIGGLLAGASLRLLELEPHPGFSRLYTAAWMVRSGVPFERAYDDVAFARSAEAIAPSGLLLRPSSGPPTSALLALPFTGLVPRSASFLFGALNLLALLLGLALLIGEEPGVRFDRSDGFVLAGAALASAAFAASLRLGEPAGLLLLSAAALFRADAARSNWRTALLFATIAQVSGIVLLLPLLWWREGRRRLALLALASWLVFGLLLLLFFGPASYVAWLEHVAREVFRRSEGEPWSLPAALMALLPPLSPGSPPIWRLLPVGMIAIGAALLLAPRVARGRANTGAATAGALLFSALFAPGNDSSIRLALVVPLWFTLREATRDAVGHRAWLWVLGLALLVTFPWPRGPAESEWKFGLGRALPLLASLALLGSLLRPSPSGHASVE